MTDSKKLKQNVGIDLLPLMLYYSQTKTRNTQVRLVIASIIMICSEKE